METAAPRQPIAVIPLLAVIVSGFAVAGAVFLWLLRNAGHAYRLGYLLGFGFQPDALPWNTDDLGYLGYYVQEDYLVPLLGVFFGFAIFVAAVCFTGNVVRHRAAQKRARRPVKVNENQSGNLLTTEVLFCWFSAIVIAVLFICSIVPFALLDPARTRGEKDAMKAMTAIQKWDIKEMNAHQMKFVEIVRDKAGLASGVPISCTDKLCALYSPVGPVHARTVPLTDILSWSTIELENVPSNERGTQSH